MMGNVSQVTPDGTLSYNQTGTHSWHDPYTGHTYDIPTFTATQTLSPEQERLRALNMGAQENLAGIANQQSGFLQDYLRGGVDTSGIPGLATSAGQQAGIGGGYSSDFDRSFGRDYDTRFDSSLGRDYSTRFDGNIGGNYTDSVDLATSYAGADDFSADRQRVEDALWERGADARAREEEALRTRLMNSGLREGSAAWNSEMERMGRQVADERIGTMLASGQEQSRLVGMARDAAMFGNDANLAMGNFGNQSALARAQFGSQQQQLQNAAAMGQAQFGREGQLLQNAATMAEAQFGREGQLAQNAAAMGEAQFGNDARLRNAQFQNAARGQGLQEAYAARSQPINEIIGLMAGSQVQQPNFVNAQMPTIPTTDTAGIINDNYQQRLAQWQANQGVLGGIMGGFGTLLGAPTSSVFGSMIGLSDERAKKDKRKIGHIDGIDLDVHEYRYKGESSSAPKRVGLMAQEVERKNPSAVIKRNGIRYVDYGRALSGKKGVA